MEQNEKNEEVTSAENSLKEYESIIVPGLKVTVANYIAEILLRRRSKTKNIPAVEFWRKEYQDNPEYKELTQTYIAELGQVKKMLKVFSPQVVVENIKNGTTWTLVYLKNDEASVLVFQLFKDQIKYITSLKEMKKTELEVIDDKVEFIAKFISKNTKIRKGL